LASLRYGFEDLGLERIISITLPTNVASRRVMEKTGLTFRGETHWRGFDVVWYAIDRQGWEAGG
jgi:ribosomal-protein-alanine N-acetyltransferase